MMSTDPSKGPPPGDRARDRSGELEAGVPFRAFLDLAESQGWTLVKLVGSHRILQSHDKGMRVSVEVLNQRIDEEDFRELVQLLF